MITWREGLEIDLDKDHDLEFVEFEWADWLAEVGLDYIQGTPTIISDPEVQTSGITVENSTAVRVLVQLDGGTAVDGTLYNMSCKIATQGGQTKIRSIGIRSTPG